MNFQDDTHALRTGMLMGMLLKAGITVVPETDDEGNYTDRLIITLDASLPMFATHITVVTLPPE